MAKSDLKNMEVDALLALRADVEKMLGERSHDLQRQLALLGGSNRIQVAKSRSHALR